ncbi:MAG: hypothetical protein WEF86_10805 [Gemmatimonadota bacterium]
MTLAKVALLLGMFGVPAYLLWMGHRLRDRSEAERGAFWGGVIGHTIALLLSLLALHFPPVLWTGGTRITLAFWLMLLGGTAGALVGALRGRSAGT